jgi:hypothetical protein
MKLLANLEVVMDDDTDFKWVVFLITIIVVAYLASMTILGAMGKL